MSIDVKPPSAQSPIGLRLDGTPLTPTCEIPLKSCGCLAGDDCDCLAPGEFGDWFDRPIYMGLR